MADPQRLLADPAASPVSRALLASAAEDGMSPESRGRLAGRLGIAGALAVTTTAGQGIAAALWWKIGTVLIALSGVTALAISQTPDEPVAYGPTPTPVTIEKPATIASPTPKPAAVGAVTPPTPSPSRVKADVAPPLQIEPLPARAQPVRPAPRPSPPSPTKVPAVDDAPIVPAVETPTPEPPPAPPPAPVKVDARRLAAEVALIDRARAAVRARDGAAAEAALAAYAQTFPDGALAAEAEVVGIEALVARGDAPGAAARANAFLARFPHSPLARRVRSIAFPPADPKETP